MARKQGFRQAKNRAIIPTNERLRQGRMTGCAVEKIDLHHQESNRRVLAYRAVDTVGRLLRAGKITTDGAKAARGFAADFLTAGLGGSCRAAPMIRMPRQTGTVRHETEASVMAREAVAEAMTALGGFGSTVANALWYVVGTEMSIKDWARRERWGRGAHIHEHTAAGLVVGAIAGLRAFRSKEAKSR